MRSINHEGYHDPTAGKAIRRVYSSKKRRQARTKKSGLTYPMRKATGFQEAVEIMARCEKRRLSD